MSQIIHEEFKQYGLAVVTTDQKKLLIEGIPKPNFKNANFFAGPDTDRKLASLVNLKGNGLFIKNSSFLATTYISDFSKMKINDFVTVAEIIYSKILNTKFCLREYARIIMMPETNYSKFERMIAENYPDIMKDNPDYYKNTSAILANNEYIIIKERKLDISMLTTLAHEIGHLVTPSVSDPEILEFYAYYLEHIFYRLFHDEYFRYFPKAKSVYDFTSKKNTTSSIHNNAYEKAHKYYNNLLLSLKSP